LSAVLDRRVRASYAAGTGGATPEAVAKVVVTAATTAHPRTRYKVTAQARLLPAARALLPDRAWDRLLASQFRVGPIS
jgi:hypothetical protein